MPVYSLLILIRCFAFYIGHSVLHTITTSGSHTLEWFLHQWLWRYSRRLSLSYTRIIFAPMIVEVFSTIFIAKISEVFVGPFLLTDVCTEIVINLEMWWIESRASAHNSKLSVSGQLCNVCMCHFMHPMARMYISVYCTCVSLQAPGDSLIFIWRAWHQVWQTGVELTLINAYRSTNRDLPVITCYMIGNQDHNHTENLCNYP